MDATPFSSVGRFAPHLAQHCIARRHFAAKTLPEAAALAGACDLVITRLDDVAFQIICMIDGQAHPGKRFELPGDVLLRIGEDCLASEKAHGTPSIEIQVFEIGPGLDNQETAARLVALADMSSSNVFISGWIVDTATRSIWTSAALRDDTAVEHDEIERLLIERLLQVHSTPSTAPSPIAVPPASIPYLTYTLLGLIIAVFGFEHQFGIGNYTKLFEPTLATLAAMGGTYWPKVVEQGEWYRIISASFLHADAMHLLLNGFVLLFAGRMLERAVGPAWFGAIYAVSGICGSLASLALNPTNMVGIGASGAIMGLLSAAFVSSFRFEDPLRKRLQTRSLQFLIPSLLPLASTAAGYKIDYGAHLGGAVGGALVAAVMFMQWPRDSALPKYQRFAAAAAAVWMFGAALSAACLIPSYPEAQHEYGLWTLLIPESKLRRSREDLTADAENLVAQYPRDPRSHFYRAMNLFHRGNLKEGERSLRAALEEQEVLKKALSPKFEDALVALLAMTLIETGRTSEAKVIAKPICNRFEPPDENSHRLWKQACEQEDLQALLIPDEKLPPFDTAVSKADALVSQYPRDPRAHYYLAVNHIQKRNWPEAERALRKALDERELLTSWLPPSFQEYLQGTHSLILSEEDRTAEAKVAAGPVCKTFQPWSDETRDVFKRLCEQ